MTQRISPATMLLAAAAMLAVLTGADKPATDKAPPAKSAAKPPSTLPSQFTPEKAAETYDLCLDTAKAYPDQALDLANRWQEFGGGEAAKHCAGVALISLRRYTDAGRALEDLARESKKSDALRAGLWAQAGQAWFMAGNTDRAYNAQSEGLKIAPERSLQHVDILIDRALTLADEKKYADAITDLSGAIVLQPKNADALAFRASAYRHLNAIDRALTDAERAVAADAKNVNALLERGILYGLNNRDADARHDWEKVIELAPESDIAGTAREDITKIGPAAPTNLAPNPAR